MKKINFFSIILLLLTWSCETDVDTDEVFKNDTKIAIQSYISPFNETVKVRVARVVSSFGIPPEPEELIIKNAAVTMANNDGVKVNLTYNQERFNYEIPATEFGILPGGSYFLKVVVAGEIYTANCTVPTEAAPLPKNLATNTANFVVRTSFDDPQGVPNYYFAELETLQDPQQRRVFEEGAFFTDQGRDGQQISLEIPNDPFTSGFLIIPDGEPLKIRIYSLDERIYLWRSAQDLLDINLGSFSEAPTLPSNIIGADVIGVFSGYRVTEQILMPE